MEWYDYLIIGVVIAAVITICVLIAVFYHRSESAYNQKVSFSRMNCLVTKRSNFLTEKEYEFFKVLASVAGSLGYVAFPKVCVGNLVNCREHDDKHTGKSHPLHSIVDFCLFSSIDFAPIAVIDLYDNTINDHSMLNEMDRNIVRSIMYSGIPIFKINYNDGIDPATLKKSIVEEIAAFEKNILMKEKREEAKKQKQAKKEKKQG